MNRNGRGAGRLAGARRAACSSSADFSAASPGVIVLHLPGDNSFNYFHSESAINYGKWYMVITRHAGTEREKVERRTVILRRECEQVKVAEVQF
jgi:hypothetical protein